MSSFWQKSNKHVWLIGLVIGVLFMAVGLWQEQFRDIYAKAVMICLECIGIG